MKGLLLIVAIVMASLTISFGQQKLSKEESAKMTQDQRIAYENDRQHAKHKKKKNESVKKKAKRAKKQDRQSRKIKQPKHKKNEY